MNYRLGWSSLSWAAGERLRQGYQREYPLNPLSGEELISIWTTTAGWYRPQVNRSQMNLLDSHDVPRALHTLDGDVEALKLALLMLFLQPGAPCIYYGTETGLAGGPTTEQSSGPEPGCREAFPWDQPWTADLRPYLKDLAVLRREHPVLSDGSMQWSCCGDDGLVARSGSVQVWSAAGARPFDPVGVIQRDSLALRITQKPSGAVGTQSAVLLMSDEALDRLELVTSPYQGSAHC